MKYTKIVANILLFFSFVLLVSAMITINAEDFLLGVVFLVTSLVIQSTIKSSKSKSNSEYQHSKTCSNKSKTSNDYNGEPEIIISEKNGKVEESKKDEPLLYDSVVKKEIDIIGKTVYHKKYGSGKIKKKESSNNSIYITVCFENKTCRFVFPDAFDIYLFTQDDELKEMLNLSPKKTKPVLEKPHKVSTVYNPKEKLEYKKYYGTNTREIYLKCCKWFGWDDNQKHNFGKQGALLYAKEATKESYSPWFIAHSNLSYGEAEHWKNKIIKNFIFEEWKTNKYNPYNDQTIRVVFAKVGESNYYFFGVYRVYKIELQENSKYMKTYIRISETYPL